jgi:hypothetical protein
MDAGPTSALTAQPPAASLVVPFDVPTCLQSQACSLPILPSQPESQVAAGVGPQHNTAHGVLSTADDQAGPAAQEATTMAMHTTELAIKLLSDALGVAATADVGRASTAAHTNAALGDDIIDRATSLPSLVLRDGEKAGRTDSNGTAAAQRDMALPHASVLPVPNLTPCAGLRAAAIGPPAEPAPTRERGANTFAPAAAREKGGGQPSKAAGGSSAADLAAATAAAETLAMGVNAAAATAALFTSPTPPHCTSAPTLKPVPAAEHVDADRAAAAAVAAMAGAGVSGYPLIGSPTFGLVDNAPTMKHPSLFKRVS